jgi:hypothetical protein
MFSGGDEDVSKYGDVDSDEKIREILVSTKNKVAQEELIKILSKKICELQEDIRLKDSLLSELQVPAKWYDNIPEQGVLCWCKEHEDDIKYKRLLERIDEYTEGRFLSRTTGFLYKVVQPLTNEEIEEFKR